MENLRDIKDYGTFKAALDTEMKKSVESFVRIGYLLRKAMDTDILHESGYKSVVEFAKAEYNIEKGQVSRFIAINERFSVGGYSDELQERYQKFGLAKLQEMLQLPDHIIEDLTSDLTRNNIQEIKKEIQEEEKVTDMEVILELEENKDASLSEKALWAYMEDDTHVYERLYKVCCDNQFSTQTQEQIMDAIAPSGVLGAVTRHISGLGRVMLSVDSERYTMTFRNTRSGEKEVLTMEEVLKKFSDIFRPAYSKGMEHVWQQVYNFNYPKEEKTAPVQQEKHQAEKAPVKQHEREEKELKKEDNKPQAESQKNAINTECGDNSTPKVSTTDFTDRKGVVFNEMLGVANGLVACVLKKDIEGIQEHVVDIQHILDSLAADKKKDIPGQMELEEIIEGEENVKEQN